MTIYELTSEYQELLALAEEGDLDPQMLADTMESVGAEIEDKADGYAKVLAQLTADIDGIKAEIARLTEKKNSLEANVKRMKETLQYAMQVTGKTKFKTGLFSFGIQKNPPSAALDDEKLLPAWYFIPQDPKIDKRSILDDLKAGKEVPGAHLEQSESLRIR